MIFVEELNIGGQMRLEEVFYLVVVGAFVDEVMAGADTGGVGIDDEYGAIESVKED